MTEEEEMVKLAKIIKNNPEAVAYIDNDSWHLYRLPPPDFDDWSKVQQDDWYDTCQLACSNDFKFLGITHGYGLLEAMAHILNIELDGV